MRTFKEKGGRQDGRKKKHFMKKVEFLENPEKRGDILPEELLDMLPIQQTDTFF